MGTEREFAGDAAVPCYIVIFDTDKKRKEGSL